MKGLDWLMKRGAGSNPVPAERMEQAVGEQINGRELFTEFMGDHAQAYETYFKKDVDAVILKEQKPLQRILPKQLRLLVVLRKILLTPLNRWR